MSFKGAVWNESEVYPDPITRRPVRRLTKFGIYNQTPTYHTNVGFTADGKYLVLATARGGRSAVLKANVETGELTQLTDSVPHVGTRGELHKQGGGSIASGDGITGTLMCLAPHSRWCVYTVGGSVRAVHLDTLEERVLIADAGEEWIFGVPSISLDETEVLVPMNPAHPQMRAGDNVTTDYMAALNAGLATPALRIVSVPLAGGPAVEVYHEKGCTGAHTPHNPVHEDLVLIDRDFPPKYWGGSDNGKTTRIWVWNKRTGEVAPLNTRNERMFQVHSVWTWDGETVLYHGPAAEGGWYIGAISRHGEVIGEWAFPDYNFYGHVSADRARKAIILDGTLTKDYLLWFYYDEGPTPRIEIICRHATEWRGIPGQYSDPHPLADPTGRWISFNRAQGGRTDVYAVEVG